MNKRLVKILVIIVIIIGILFGGVTYYISSQIKTEDIRKMVVETLNKQMPGAISTLKSVDYGVGGSVKIYLGGLNLESKETKKDLFSVNDIEVKIPIWSLLTGSGAITVKVTDPSVSLKMNTYGGTNWDNVFAKSEKINEVKESKDDGKIEIPSFLKEAKLNVSIDRTNVLVKQGVNPESKILVKKIRLKNLNLKKSSAFEILTNVKYSLNKADTFAGDFHVVGELNIAKFIEKKILDVKIHTNMKRMSLTGLPLSIPNVKAVQRVVIDEKGIINIDNDITAGDAITSKSKVIINNSMIKVSGIETIVNIEEAVKLLNSDIKSGLNSMSFKQASLSIGGNLSLNTKDNKFNPDIMFGMKKPVTLNQSGLNVANTFKGSFKGDKVKVTAISELLNGSITTSINTKLNPLKLPAKMDKYQPVNVSLLMTNLKIKKKVIQEILYGGSSKNTSTDEVAQGEVKPGEEVILPPVNVTIKSTNVFISDQLLKISSTIRAKSKTIESKKFTIGYGSGSTAITFKTYLKTTASIFTNMTLKLTKMNFAGLHPFLPKGLDNITGVFAGDVKGKVDLVPEGLKYDMNIDFKAKDGTLKDLDLASYVKPMINKVSFLKGKADKLIISDSYEKLLFKGKATDRQLTIKNFVFSTGQKGGSIKANGKVSMVGGNSKVQATLIDTSSDVGRTLKKETGKSELPLMLKGQGFGLIPDVGYTLGELTKKAGKQQVKKATKKIKKKVKKKIENKLKNEAKKLFKGIKF